MTWSDILAEEKQKPYFKQILDFLACESAKGKVISQRRKIFLMLLSILS